MGLISHIWESHASGPSELPVLTCLSLLMPPEKQLLVPRYRTAGVHKNSQASLIVQDFANSDETTVALSAC